MNMMLLFFVVCSSFSFILFLLNLFLRFRLQKLAERTQALSNFRKALEDILSDERVPITAKKHLLRTVVFIYDKSRARNYIEFTEKVLNGECEYSGDNNKQYYVGQPDLIKKSLLVYMTALSIAGVCAGQSVRAEQIRLGLVSGVYGVRKGEEGCFANFIKKLPKISKQNLLEWGDKSFFQLGNIFDGLHYLR